LVTVTDHLGKRGVPFEVIPHEQTYTTIDEARALGIDADDVLKSLMLKTRSGDVLAVLPGSRRLDKRLVEEAAGDRHARLATEEELERDYPGFELGALPPLGSLLGTRVLVDAAVYQHETVVFAAGRRTESIRMRTEDVFRDEPVRVGNLSVRPEIER
jgi:prolyl-tRNA editing enzyme YbaK/EbsC (Cys-tRNA(Pro) deacylase)